MGGSLVGARRGRSATGRGPPPDILPAGRAGGKRLAEAENATTPARGRRGSPAFEVRTTGAGASRGSVNLHHHLADLLPLFRRRQRQDEPVPLALLPVRGELLGGHLGFHKFHPVLVE